MQTTDEKYGLRQCPNCGKEFTVRRINMVYCEDQCRKKATNTKLMEKYHSRKKMKNMVRYCSECDTRLSKYNEHNKCNPCIRKDENTSRRALLNQLGIEYIDEDS